MGDDAAEALDELWEVVREGDRATIEALLVGDEEHPPLGCSCDVMDGTGMTPLMWLVVEGHSKRLTTMRSDPVPDSTPNQPCTHSLSPSLPVCCHRRRDRGVAD